MAPLYTFNAGKESAALECEHAAQGHVDIDCRPWNSSGCRPADLVGTISYDPNRCAQLVDCLQKRLVYRVI